MTPRDFMYWLQGFFEISGSTELTPAQIQIIRNHINLVFKETLDLPDPDGSSQAVHDGKIHTDFAGLFPGGVTQNNKTRGEQSIERIRRYQPGQKC